MGSCLEGEKTVIEINNDPLNLIDELLPNAKNSLKNTKIRFRIRFCYLSIIKESGILFSKKHTYLFFFRTFYSSSKGVHICCFKYIHSVLFFYAIFDFKNSVTE